MVTQFHSVLLGFTGFRVISLGFGHFSSAVSFGSIIFTKFYWVLLGFTGFYRVLPSFMRFFPISSSCIHCNRVSFGFDGLYWVLPSFTEFYRVLPSFTEFYLVLSHSA